MDFSRCALSDRYYGGSEQKMGIVYQGTEYMLKFQKKTAFGTRNNHISEYIGSHIFGILGFDVQNTLLGTYKGNKVVACQDFVAEGTHFVPFNDVGESTLDEDKEAYQYSYKDIMRMLADNSKLTNIEETTHMFWKIYVADALLGNFDRHGANWGFIKKENQYSLAPVFDNGSCLFPNMADEDEMRAVMDSEEETNKRIFRFPTSQIKLDGRKSSYYEVIHSLRYKECNEALVYIYNHFDVDEIDRLLEETPMVSDVQKKFYHHMIMARFEKIIRQSYDCYMKGGVG
jgi:hypothetical protein